MQQGSRAEFLQAIYIAAGILCSQHYQGLYKWSLGKIDCTEEKYIPYLEVFCTYSKRVERKEEGRGVGVGESLTFLEKSLKHKAFINVKKKPNKPPIVINISRLCASYTLH